MRRGWARARGGVFSGSLADQLTCNLESPKGHKAVQASMIWPKQERMLTSRASWTHFQAPACPLACSLAGSGCRGGASGGLVDSPGVVPFFCVCLEWTLLKPDVTKAHRRTEAVEGSSDRGGLVGQQGGNLWHGECPNRVAARILYYAFAWLDWGFVFVVRLVLAFTPGEGATTGDSNFAAATSHGHAPQRAVTEQHLAGIPGRPHHSHKAIEKPLGRLQWATSACPITRVYLQSFRAWKQACHTAGLPPKIARMLVLLLRELLDTRYTQFSPFTPVGNW